MDWVVSHGCNEVKWLVLHVRQDCTVIGLPYLAAVFSVNEFLTLQSQYVWCCLNVSFCTCLLSNIHICNNFYEINLMFNFIWDAWPSCGTVASNVIIMSFIDFHFTWKVYWCFTFHDLHMCMYPCFWVLCFFLFLLSRSVFVNFMSESLSLYSGILSAKLKYLL